MSAIMWAARRADLLRLLPVQTRRTTFMSGAQLQVSFSDLRLRKGRHRPDTHLEYDVTKLLEIWHLYSENKVPYVGYHQ